MALDDTQEATLRAELAALTAARDAATTDATTRATEAQAAKTAAEALTAELAAIKAAGDATAAELSAARAAADTAQKVAADLAAKVAQTERAALDARIGKLPATVQAMAPKDVQTETLTAWLSTAEAIAAAVPALPPTQTGSGQGPEAPTEADLKWAAEYGYASAKPSTIIAASKAHGPRSKLKPTPAQA